MSETRQAGGEAGSETPWFSGMDYTVAGFTAPAAGQADELKGYLENRGWAGKTPAEVAFHAIKAHREAEKYIGVTPDKLIRLPKDAGDTAAWQELRTKLGVPADGKYDFSAVKFSDGSELSEDFTSVLSSVFANANVSKDKAVEAATALIKQMEAGDASEVQAYEQKIALERDELQKNWGNRFNANKAIAQETAKKFGLTPEVVDLLEKTPGVGYAKLMEFFRAVGEATGEDKFIRDTNPGGGGGPMSRDAALASLAAFKNDNIKTQKLLAGDSDTIREFDMLTRAAQ